MVVCPFCKQQTDLMRGPDGFAVCPLCHNHGTPQTGAVVKPKRRRTVKNKAPGSNQTITEAPPEEVPSPAGQIIEEEEIAVIKPDPIDWQPIIEAEPTLRPVEQEPAYQASVEGKSPAGAALRSWFMPGWGQGYVYGARKGWTWFAIWVSLFIAAVTYDVQTNSGVSGLIMLPLGLGQVIYAAHLAKRWNRENNAYAPKTGVLKAWLFIFLGILAFIVLAAVVFVLVSNASPTDDEPLDYSILTPPANAEILLNNDQQSIGFDEFFRQDIELVAPTQLTYAFISENRDVLDVCLTYPANEEAFSKRQAVDCFFLETKKIQGQRTVTLPAGTYSVFTIGAYGDSARIQVSAWGTPA